MRTYALKVEGLGEIRALTMENVLNDEDARQRVKLICTSDPRVQPVALYRIERVLADPESDEPNKQAATYLMTGLGKHHDKSRDAVLSDFFETKEIRLYHCTPVSLT